MKLKIAYFIDRLIRGGTELQLVEQINRLAERGIHQELFILYESTEQSEIRIACKVHILGIRKLMSLTCFSKLLFLRNYLKSCLFNVVQTYFFDSTFVGVLAGNMSFIPKVLSCRRDLGFWYTRKLLMVLRFLNMFTDQIIVNSDAVREVVINRESVPSEKISIIPNGIDLCHFEYSEEKRAKSRVDLGIPSERVVVGIIANMTRRVKRVDIFIDSAAYVLKHSDDYHFLILGDGKYKKELVERTRRLGIENRVTFLGRDVSKHNVLSAMDIGVLSSDSEGFSNSVMEYMAAGLPVIASEVGGNCDIVENGKTGFLIPAGDFIGFGEKILFLGQEKQTRLMLSEMGRKKITNYDWQTVIDKIISFYLNQFSE